MIIRTLEELQAPDELAQHFTPYGFGTSQILTPESAARFHQEVIASTDLVEAVVSGVRDSFERLRTVYAYGVLSYEMFTVAQDLARLVIEQALRERFMEYNDGRVVFVNKKGDELPVPVESFDAVRKVVGKLERKNSKHKEGWCLKLRHSDTAMPFRGMLSDLWTWARREGLLPGQRARIIQRAYVQLRNTVAHRQHHTLGTPVDAARVIRDVAEVINQLWGVPTPDGRLHPAPVRREILAISWNDAGHVHTGPAENLAATDTPGDQVCILVRAAVDGSFEPMQFHAQYETTVSPGELVWGPGTVQEAAAWYEQHRPAGDETDLLDRLFLIQSHDGRLDPPQRIDVAAGREHADRVGVWSLVRADDPRAAYAHIRQMLAGERSCAAVAPCGRCAAETVGGGTWQEMMDRLRSMGVTVTPRRMPDVSVPSPLPPWGTPA